MRIAVIGGGISGLVAAWLLSARHDVTLYEATSRLGGHSHTVTIPPHPAVDVGFAAFNPRTQPNFAGLLDTLGVAHEPSDATYSVSFPKQDFEFSNVALFAKPRLLFSPAHWHFLKETSRFRVAARAVLASPAKTDVTLVEFLNAHKFSGRFVRRFIAPLSGFSAKTLERPAHLFFQRLDGMGFLGASTMRTISGGTDAYVSKLASSIRCVVINAPVRAITRESSCARVELSDGRYDKFDQVVLACHADQAAGLIADPYDEELALLNGVSYTTQFVSLHQDDRLMPMRRKVWSAWNFIDGTGTTLWMNRLQPFLPYEHSLFVTISPKIVADVKNEIARYSFAVPSVDESCLLSQRLLPHIQGRHRLWFCGAWCGNGFNEDAVTSALSVVQKLAGITAPWFTSASTSATQDFKVSASH